MKATSFRQRRSSRLRRGAQRWRVPPPLRGGGGCDGPEGLSILQEIKGPLGTLLWTTLRSVNAWVDTPPSERSALFPERAADWQTVDILAAGPQRELESALQDLTALLRPSSETQPEVVGQAATRVARWADYNGFRSTSAAYFEAAANACLGNPAYSLAAGRSARDHARYPQAEAWLQRAIGVARQVGNWATYTDAYLAYGTMMRRRGNMPAARKRVERALRRARRESLRELQAKAYHDLFVIEFECEHFELANRYAVQAWRQYPAEHANQVRLAHDIGYLWLASNAFKPALQVFKALEARISSDVRPNLLGAMALAAGGCEDRSTFSYAARNLDEVKGAVHVAEAWLEVAQGAIHLTDHREALLAARKSLAIATARREHKIIFLAEEVIETAQRNLDRIDLSQKKEAFTAECVTPDFGFPEEIIRTLQPV